MTPKEIRSVVEKTISDVRRRGDAALVELVRKHDKMRLSPKKFRVPPSQIKAAVQKISLDVRRALEACARRIQEFHYNEKKHITQSWTFAKDGVRMGQIYNPIDAVGVYVPGGRFSYPSTLLMTAIPARLAGVNRIAVVTPPTRLSNEILAAAHLAGVDEMYRVGGPGAIAALAVGTKSIPKVDLIVGPGNAFVTEAKRQLFGEVGIDLLAGPSELVVLADDSASAQYVAADLAAQAEHDPESKGFLISMDRKLVEEVKALLPKSLIGQCELIYQPDANKAVAYANNLAGEHVQIMLRRPQDCMDTLKNGGTFFLNAWSPAVMGDYWAGPSHVLPTGRSARFASGLSVMTFLKRSSLIEISSAAFKKGFQAAHQMAETEGLTQHAHALRARINEDL
jgi:histidinol dehydrogenase